MLKKIAAFLLCAALVFAFTSCTGNNIATVDGVNVDKGYFNYYFNKLKQQLAAELGEDSWEETQYEGKTALEYAKERALQSAIEDCIVTERALKDGISLTADDVKAIKQLKDSWISYYGSEEKFNEKELKANGITSEQFDYMMKAVYYKNHLIEKYTDASDEKTRQFYDNNIVKVKHILILTIDPDTGKKLPDDEVAAAKNEAEKLLDMATSNSNFDALVAEYTDDRDSFYYIGEGFSLNADGTEGTGMVPDFENAAFALGVGEVSGIVESEYGYHIIKRYENDSEMFETARNTLSFKVRSEEFSGVLNDWKSKMKIIVNESLYNSQS